MTTKSPGHIHEIHRLNPDGTETPMPQADAPGLYLYSLRGYDDWATAERYLVDQFTAGQWEPGRYRVTVTHGTPVPVATVERTLPLHPDYAKLPYSHPRSGEPALPVRAYIHRLLDVYTGATLEQIAAGFEAFNAHYRAEISTQELAARTGYTLATDRPRPLSPYAAYPHPDSVPDEVK